MELKEFFKTYNRVALGFSGGADSAYLLSAGLGFGADIKPYFVKSAFQPEFELRDAERLCAELGVELSVIELNVLSDERIKSNSPERCYYCKKSIFSIIKKQAEADGYETVIDGTNASDSFDDRPGMRAIQELGILSPLRLCGITKAELRSLSREAGVFTWDKPSYSCLATRIAAGEEITADTLSRIEAGEKCLFEMGFSDFRLRTADGKAKLQVKAEQAEKAKEAFGEITEKLSIYFSGITLDSEYR